MECMVGHIAKAIKMAFVSRRRKVISLWIVLLLQILLARRRRLREERIRRARARLERFRRFFQRQRSERAMFISTLGTLLTEVNVHTDKRHWPRRTAIISGTASNYWWESHHSWTEEFWLENLRIPRTIFEYLCEELSEVLRRKNTWDFIPVSKGVALALWKLATNADRFSIESTFGVVENATSKIVQQVCEAIIEKFMECYVHLPNGDRGQGAALEFGSAWGLPQCVGVIDYMLIPVSKSSDRYDNPNDVLNVLTQILVDNNHCVLNFHIGVGDNYDEKFIKSSDLFQKGQNGTLFPSDVKNVNGTDVPYFIVANAIWPVLPWVMTPYLDSGSTTSNARLFNNKLADIQEHGREAVKRLKGRWHYLQASHDSSDFIKLLVQACIVLHNICEKRKIQFNTEWSMNGDVEMSSANNSSERHPDNAENIRKAIGEFIAEDISTEKETIKN